jgi:uncharacterized membrane protein AbrB (regulator of aidB expression)
MAHNEDKLAWFKRNMNRVKTVDTEHLVFYTALSIIFLIFVAIIVAFFFTHFTPPIFS